MSPSSPRQVNIDPHLPAPNRSHAITLSPNALSPSRAIGPHHPQHIRGNSGHGRGYREDPETARERQVQQDLESAMSMCKSTSPSFSKRFIFYVASQHKGKAYELVLITPSPRTFWFYRQPRHITRYASISNALPFQLAYRRNVFFHAFRPGRSRDGPSEIVSFRGTR